MKIKFIGNPREEDDQREGTEMFGIYFPLDDLIDVSGLEDWQLKRLKGNTHFEAGKRRGRPPKQSDGVDNGNG